jgi:hypothetical protein
MMRTFVTVMCVVGLASGPGIVSHVPSDYRGKPYEGSVYKSGAQAFRAESSVPNSTWAARAWPITIRETISRILNLSIHNGNRFLQAGKCKSCEFNLCVGAKR